MLGSLIPTGRRDIMSEEKEPPPPPPLGLFPSCIGRRWVFILFPWARF
jgi:hypothetical protein